MKTPNFYFTQAGGGNIHNGFGRVVATATRFNIPADRTIPPERDGGEAEHLTAEEALDLLERREAARKWVPQPNGYHIEYPEYVLDVINDRGYWIALRDGSMLASEQTYEAGAPALFHSADEAMRIAISYREMRRDGADYFWLEGHPVDEGYEEYQDYCLA